ncbi:hypothetical protein PG999_000434 [Apiospora kogelbergensis]|uniref:TPX2 C-terminal domain-containing protein n=1 Tax=Apiospora kogelbergensis TaxID=1337665 RepID=A0AAW0RBX4_9PEZI
MDHTTVDGTTAPRPVIQSRLGFKRSAPNDFDEKSIEGMVDDVPRIRPTKMRQRPTRHQPSRRSSTQVKADARSNDGDSDVVKYKAQSEARAQHSILNSRPTEILSAHKGPPTLRPATEGRILTRAAAANNDKTTEKISRRAKNSQGRTPLPVLPPEEMRRRMEIRERRKEQQVREERNALWRVRSGH